MEEERERKAEEERKRQAEEAATKFMDEWQMKDSRKGSKAHYEEDEDGVGYLTKQRPVKSMYDQMEHRFVTEEDEFPSDESETDSK